jgi:hypothetical protein
MIVEGDRHVPGAIACLSRRSKIEAKKNLEL